MYRKSEMVCRSYILTLIAVLACCSIASSRSASASSPYSLSREGYSPSTNTLLLRVYDRNVPVKLSWFGTYDLTGGITRQHLAGTIPSDFAWNPRHDAFIVTLLNRMTLLHKNGSNNDYAETTIQCPADFLFINCSWSPNGEWLAVNCLNTNNIARSRLGLYNYRTESFVLTNLWIDHRSVSVVWASDSLLYATRDNNVLAIELKGEKPSVVRTFPLDGELTIFYDVFDQQPLYLSHDEVRLGDRTMITLDLPRKFRVIATEKVVFVSASPGQLAAFDRSGHEISTIDPGRLMKFGSVRGPNTVYAIADSDLVRICIEKGSLRIDTVSDLHDSVKNAIGSKE